MQRTLAVVSPLLLLLLTLLAPTSALAQLDFPGLDGNLLAGGADAPKVFVEASVASTPDPKKFELRVTAAIEPGWHIYSITQKPGGPKPSKLQLGPSELFTLAGPWGATPAPIVKQSDIWPDLSIEEHVDKVTWKAPLTLAAGANAAELKIGGSLFAQACSETTCLDQTMEFEAAFNAAESDASQQSGELSYSAGGVTVSGHLNAVEAKPGDRVQLTLVAEPNAGWHVYALHDPAAPKMISNPTRLALTDRSGLLAATPTPDQEVVTKTIDLPGGAVTERYHHGAVAWIIDILVPENAPAGEHLLRGVVGYQACADDESGCDMPAGTSFVVPLVVGSETLAGRTPVRFEASSYSAVRNAAEAAAPWDRDSDKSADPALQPEPLTFAAALPWLAAAFGAGFILNFMPCVLPVIGLKLMGFVHQAGQSRMRIFTLNLWYVAGLMLVFMGLACLAAFLGWGWGEQFQKPEFAVAMAAVVFVFALSMLGVWEIPIPGFVGSGKATELAAHEGPTGAFFKGVLTTVLATPCAGPLLVPALTWALKQSQPVIFGTFFMLGLGMAFPYLLIGAFPQLVKWLPKPGAWMDTFKQIMGFVLLGTVVFIFTFIQQAWFVPTLALLFALWASCWWIGRTPLTASFGPKLRAWLIGGAFSAAVGLGAFGLSTVQGWELYSPTKLADLKKNGTPVLIDFTATWCLTCQVNKGTALYTDETTEFMKRHGVVGLKADKTTESPDIDQLLIELGNASKGIPFYAVFPADGGTPILMDGLLTQEKLLGALRQAVGENTAQTGDADAKSPRTARLER